MKRRVKARSKAVTSKRPVRGKQVIVQFRVPAIFRDLRPVLRNTWVRVSLLLIIVVLLCTELFPVIQPKLAAKNYDLGSNTKVLAPASPTMASKIAYDTKKAAYQFNADYNPGAAGEKGVGGSRISATAYSDPAKGVTVSDPVNNIDMTIKPKFGLAAAKQQENRVVYPLNDGTGWLVYSMEAAQVKEDVLLSHANGDRMTLKYDLNLGDSLEARIVRGGAIGVYGSTLLSGNVSTGSAKDAALLQKARKKAAKNTLLFVIPAPVTNEYNQTKSTVKAHYELQGSELTLVATGLKKAHYPLSIDPSVYVTSAAQFMQGNNESNIDFDTTNDLIQKGKLTGARIPSWSSTTVLPAARWSAGYAAGGGYAYVVGGGNGGANQATVYWSAFNTAAGSNTMVAPGACGATVWCTNSAYNLPAVRSGGISSVVYNGYLYVAGGTDTGCAGTNNVCSTVYMTKLSANGEPIGFTTASALSTARRYAGIAAYNNKIYMVGGQSNTTLAGEQTVEAATVNPDGTLGTWSTTGMTSIPTAGRWGATVQQYNGYLYLIGGASTTTAAATVQYIKINGDGTLATTWLSTTSFNNARLAFGGNFATIYGGYMYITSGCATLTSTSCSTFTSTTNDFQYASINADGSITNWTQSSTSLQSAGSTAMTGYGLMAWRGALYGIGGCTALTAPTGCSGTTQTQVLYSVINNDGDISGKITTPAVPQANTPVAPTCRVTSVDCDLPAAGTATTTSTQGGRMSGGAVINNGYLYYVGGCIRNDCTTMSTHTSYVGISSTGTMVAPASCASGQVSNNWCYATQTLPAAVGAFGITTFNNTIILFDGYTGAANSTNFYTTALASDGSLGAWTTTSNATAGIATGGRAYSFIMSRANSATAGSGFLYVMGGCTGTTGVGCSAYVTEVFKCTLSSVGIPSSCSTGSQLQFDGDPNTAGSQGLGISAGASYGNYIYMAGGASGSGTTQAQQGYVFYAKIDSSYNIVDPTSGHSAWPYTTTDAAGTGSTASQLTQVRRRATAYVINGYLYVVGGHDGTSGGAGVTLTDIQLGKIDQTTGNILSYSQLKTNAGSTSIIAARWDLRSVAANGYLYMVGGCTSGFPPGSCSDGGAASATDGMDGVTEYVQVYNNWSGSPASYTTASNNVGNDYIGGRSAVYNGYMYYSGGCNNITFASCTSTAVQNGVYYSLIGADGNLGTWNSTTAMGARRMNHGFAAYNGYVYAIGGTTDATSTAAVASTEHALVCTGSNGGVGGCGATAGTVGTWSADTSMGGAGNERTDFGYAVFNGYIYVAGGTNNAGTYQSTVYYSQIGSGALGTWNTGGTAFTGIRSGPTLVAYGSTLYLMGGYNGTTYMLDTQFVAINANGSLGTWQLGTSLPQAVRQGSGFAANGYLYVFGGRSAATTCTTNTYVAPINGYAAGSSTRNSIGGWSQTSVVFADARYGQATSYSGGKAYILGGGCSALVGTGTGTTANRTIYGTLQSQPQVSSYSININTDNDVTPSKWLLNGLDNGIGAQWNLTYQSSTAANNTWGRATSVGAVTLGTPGTYTPIDGAGASTSFSQYHFLNLTVDASQAFGFPEDVTRGPTLNDITLQFAANPSKRLRNGKTFTGGVQQPLDTPF